MAKLSIENMPDELYDELKKSAAKNQRSVDKEAIACLEKALESGRKINKEHLMERIRANREHLADLGVFVTEEDLRRAKEEGRP